MITTDTQLSALVTDWDKIESQTVGTGIKRQMVVGQNIMVCRFTFDPFVVTPEHTHPHEQVTRPAADHLVSGQSPAHLDGHLARARGPADRSREPRLARRRPACGNLARARHRRRCIQAV